MRTRRVGSVTCGGILVVFGVLFLIHMFVPMLSFRFILKLWPTILIALGAEMLIAARHSEKEEPVMLKYDKGAIFLTILMTCFACGMGLVEYFVELSQRSGYIW